MNSINVVICGRNQVTACVIRMLRKIKSVNIIGYWCESSNNQLYTDVAGIRVINGTFEDILSNKDIQFLFLCDTPINQNNLICRLHGLSAKQPANLKLSDIPYVIILPPVSPIYDIDMLDKLKSRVGFAMPLRQLPLSAALCNHFSFKPKKTRPLSNYEFIQLPTHWFLGNMESIHIRLSSVSFVDGSEYSWLYESGSMGGGLLNMFCPGLIDLVYSLTGGRQMASVASICRTFGVDSENHPFRQISADDYVTIMGELDVPTSLNLCKPVIVIIIKSSIPFIGDRSFKRPEAYFHDNHYFKLEIEVSGSDGCFLINESERKISWTSRKPVSSKFECDSGELETRLARLNHEDHFHDQRPETIEESVLEEACNGDTLINLVGGNLSRIYFGTKPKIDFEKLDETTEVARLSPNDSLPNMELGGVQDCCLSAIGEAWTNWVNNLTRSFFSERKPTEILSASPSHWGYIQSVMHAIIKSAQLRCWVDVQTGERM
ncbi:hypothetical protein EWB00_010182 [Schistosoma japonicum]|uniref:Uncharacterized protein n=1 Tax=Schistosoma japonicum TaxID=6182 RepID=A0A4Z2DPR0_SCHJA|nr:hypothetical protein EWB00_010182 [Schistosoma japonicum]